MMLAILCWCVWDVKRISRHMSIRAEALVNASRCVDCQMVTELPLFCRYEDENHDGSNYILIGELFFMVALLEIEFDRRHM